MIDPVAIRSMLAAQAGQGGQAGGGGNVASMLANLRQQLYGPQAAQQLGQSANNSLDGQGGGQFISAPLSGVASSAIGQDLQGRQLPAWQQLRNAGIAGQGSAAGNRAALAGLNAPMEIGGGAPPQPQLGGGRLQIDGDGQGVHQGGIPFAPNAPRPRGPVSINGGGLQGGPPPGMQAPPGASWQSDPSMADTGGGQWVGANGKPVDYMGRPLPAFGSGNASPGFQGPVSLPELPATLRPAPAAPGGAPGAAPAQPPAAVKPATPAARAQVPSAGAKPLTGPAARAASSAPSPAALGAEGFKGPNARRIVAARQGIYGNVQNALKRPLGYAPSGSSGK